MARLVGEMYGPGVHLRRSPQQILEKCLVELSSGWTASVGKATKERLGASVFGENLCLATIKIKMMVFNIVSGEEAIQLGEEGEVARLSRNVFGQKGDAFVYFS